MQKLNNCVCCDSNVNNSKFLFEKKGVYYYKCNCCGLIFQNPQPVYEKTEELYDDLEYQQIYLKNEYFYLPISRVYLNKMMKGLLKNNISLNNNKLLDIGCSMGLFLNLARNSGFEVEGVDISNIAGKYVKNKFGIEVKTGNFLEMDIQKNYYDIISMWQTIEHLQDPNLYLNKIYQLLKPGGNVCIATPDTGTIFSKLYRKYWGIYMPNLHINLFNKHTMNKILEKNNFKPLMISSIHETNFVYEQFEYLKFFCIRLLKNLVLRTKILKPLLPKKLIVKWENQTELDIPLPAVNYSVFAIAQKV